MIRKWLFYFLALTCCTSAFTQIDFNPLDESWLMYTGDPDAQIHTTFKSALKEKASAKKLKSFNEPLAKYMAQFAKIPNLQALYLKNNGLTSLPPAIGLMQYLRIAVIHGNPLTSIDTNIMGCKRLSVLEIRGASLDSVPRQMEDLKSLQLFRIIENKTDTLLFSDSLTTIPYLKGLQLVKTSIYTFPLFVLNIPYLENLILSGTKLSHIPDSIDKMKELKMLSLENNALYELPRQIVNCDKLEYLNLRNNKFTHLPEFILRIPNLKVLDLRGNNIPIDELDIAITYLKYKCEVLSDFEELLRQEKIRQIQEENNKNNR